MLKCAAIIFLDMDGVMIADRVNARNQEKIYRTMVETFGKRTHSPLEDRTAGAMHLDPEAVSLVMKMILKTQELGLRCGIVISSSWREDATPFEVCTTMFSSQPFSEYIIGCTPSIANFSSHTLTERGQEIQEWLTLHGKVKRFNIFDDLPMEPKGRRQTKLGKHSVLVFNGILSEENIRLGLQILKIDALHCRHCLMFNDEPPLQLKEKVILLIEKKPDSNLLDYLIRRFTTAGVSMGCVLPDTKYSDSSLSHQLRTHWVGNFRKDCSFDSAASEWIQTHQVAYSMKISEELLTHSRRVEEVNQWISNLGIFPHRAPAPDERHCRFCVFRKDELKALKKKKWIFLDINGVLTLSNHERANSFDFPFISDHSVNTFMTLISKVKKSVGIVITCSLRLNYTTDQVCSELFAKQPFGHLIMGRTASLSEEDPEFKLAKETGTLNTLLLPVSPNDLNNAVYSWRIAHELQESPYTIISSDKNSLNRHRNVTVDHILQDRDIEKALYHLST